MSDTFEAIAPQPIMEMSDQIDAIAKVLPKAQAAMGEVFKNANNPAFKSKYADLAAVIEAVVPALNSHGVTLLQPAGFEGDQVKVATMLLHESGQWVRCTLATPLQKRDAQGIGSACTYLRRYGLQAMSGVAPEDDDGNAASQPGKAPARINEQDAADLADLIKRAGVKPDVVLASCGARRLTEISASDLPTIRKKLEARLQTETQKEAA